MRYPAALVILLLWLIAPLPVEAGLTSMRAPLFGSTDIAREQAAALNAELLAPLSFAEAQQHYQRAEATFNRGGSIDSIRRYLTRAEAAFHAASAAAEIASTALEAMLQARADALASEAPEYAEADWRAAESSFNEATRRLERDSIKQAQRSAQKAQELYRAGELTAIKANYLAETRDYLKLAEKLRAQRYAPLSLSNARALLAAAEEELNANRYDTDRPRSLAADAKHNALHAIYVAKLEHRIRNKDLNLESLLLEWEASIGRLGAALDTPVYFDYGESDAIETLSTEMSRMQLRERALIEQLNERDLALASLNEQVGKMQELLGGGSQTIEELEVMLAAQARRLEQQARHKERFRTVESLFDAGQATVLRQGDTVIIRMIGLNFDSGDAGLKAEHLALLDILERAISEFPESQVVVEGHTDAFGSDEQNLSLSQARADSVVRHLLRTLPISPLNLNARGYGEARPVANNETPEGRKRNRRIDVVIEPNWIAQRTVAQRLPVQLPDIELDTAQ